MEVGQPGEWPMSSRVITVSVNADLYQRLQQESERNGNASISSIVRKALSFYLLPATGKPVRDDQYEAQVNGDVDQCPPAEGRGEA
jgi:hypothetical protein